ncbi:RagB/SusD family nutrient uptake outer membrane protein [Salegentibacter sp. T436]|uniref:RagB/SusD family nutrient uptake outer membrane protein n=1 Tax=Salegentibacter sp. T436 TaxID=1729720 RepID=UPI00094A82E3|nr:RagB/SusD family nutrient uptake outer membrane protein [Salegentibacter sp. T436]APS37441.1 carbohydrate-binding protein SusD [Salegentibacter sp. T436]
MKYKSFLILILLGVQLSCDDFVEVDVPNDRITSQTVFAKDETAISAVKGIYNQLYSADFSGGSQNSVTVLSELSADNLRATVSTATLLEFEENEIFINNNHNLRLWSSAYNIIYMTNAVLQGLENNERISPDVRTQLIGETQFIRAFTYFYLVNLFGEVPLVLTTDYQINAKIYRSSIEDVYAQIVEDLEQSTDRLDSTYENGERFRANKFTVIALLARVHLYLENWELAEELSSEVIAASDTYNLVDLNEVFLANSKEAIWQISPLEGGSVRANTREGDFFILVDNLETVALTEDLMASFSENDYRKNNWTGGFDTETNHYDFPFKYKIKNAAGEALEYSMVLRLAEQYLIRSEARAHQNKLEEAIEDLNKLRQRANLNPVETNFPEITQDQLLNLIIEERRHELFAEWGHRWFDLKRINQANEILSPIKPLWENTDVLYPIPEEEMIKNPNIDQNSGY